MNNTYTVHQLRGGAPDKIQLYHSDNLKLIHHDFTNLTDYSKDELIEYYMNSNYVLPADEGDIKYINSLDIFYQSHVLLPQTKDGNVINYFDYVPKNSIIYNTLPKSIMIYMPYDVYTITKFSEYFPAENKMAIKTVTGSGSRGVILIDKDRLDLGGKYRAELTEEDLTEFLEFARHENCDIMVQELIPRSESLFKCNVDFIIRNGKLLGYKWDKTDPSAVFTNWNFGWFIRNKYTDTLMSDLTDFLVRNGIHNAIMNFEAFSNLTDRTYLVEFNWRYSNSMFEWQAIDIDPIYNYLENIDFNDVMPYGVNKFSRYWQCKLYSDIDNYIEGK